MTTNINRQSKCMFCDSTAYGPGCPYSAHRKHVHVDNSKRCIYCGSLNFGQGCPYNPFSKVHVHGQEYNQMISDSVKQTITAAFLMHKMSEPIEETAAFKLGIVDKYGCKLKQPETIEEKSAYSPADAYIFKLRRALGPQVDIINSEIYLKATANANKDQAVELYEQELKHKNQIHHHINAIKDIFAEGMESGVSITALEKIVIECFTQD